VFDAVKNLNKNNIDSVAQTLVNKKDSLGIYKKIKK